MNDSRLKQVAALIDDARELLVDIVDERPTAESGWDLKAFNFIDASRQFLNSALVYVHKAQDPTTPEGNDVA